MVEEIRYKCYNPGCGKDYIDSENTLSKKGESISVIR